MASVFDIDIADNSVVNNIIFSNSNSNDEVRGCTLAPSTNSSRSVSSSFSNKSKELYLDQIQRESDKMDQDDPVTTSNSIQLEYTTPKE